MDGIFTANPLCITSRNCLWYVSIHQNCLEPSPNHVENVQNIDILSFFVCVISTWIFVMNMHICNVLLNFLAHLSRRLKWAIVIAHRPSSSVRRPSVRKLSTFSTSSPEPLDGFWWNLVGMKYSWSLTSVVVFRPDPPRGGSRAGPK